MPTSASQPDPHAARRTAESFGADPERYDRTRPAYPDALVERLVAGCPGGRVLDVGCGTGTAARQFQAAGCTVLGVETDPRMAEFARRGGLEVDVARFESWDPGGREFDAVVAGTAWHWVEQAAGAAKAARVLRPGGALAVFWHAFAPPPAVAEAFAAAFRRVLPDAPFDVGSTGVDGYRALLDRAADGIRQAGGFGEPEEWSFAWEHDHTRDEWLERLPTLGALTRLPQERLGQVLEAVGAAVDALGGRFAMRYTTLAVVAARTAG
jgi:SAM-dependent methyltransferase